MDEPAGVSDLAQRVCALERENRLLKTSVKQLARIRQQWTRALDELKQSKADLQASNHFLDRLLDTAPLPVLLAALPRGRIVMANAAAETLAGVGRGGLIGRPGLRLLDRPSRRRLLERLALDAASPARKAVDARMTTLQQDTRQLELHAAAVPGAPGTRGHVLVIARDVTERNQAQEKLRLAAKIIEASPQGILVLDPNRRIVDANDACAALLAPQAGPMLGQPPEALLGPGNRETFATFIWPEVIAHGCWDGEISLDHPAGAARTLWLIVRTLTNEAGAVLHYVMLLVDITERKCIEERLRFLSLHDPLTGLPNRALFHEHLELALAASRRYRTRTAMLFLDLDGFKRVNDSLGHDAGDDLLVQVSDRLRQSLRESDTVARFGGDEFAIILPNAAGAEDVATVARVLLKAVSAPYRLCHSEGRVTVSIGIAMFPEDAEAIEDLGKCADAAMYWAKASGKNAYRFFGQGCGCR